MLAGGGVAAVVVVAAASAALVYALSPAPVTIHDPDKLRLTVGVVP